MAPLANATLRRELDGTSSATLNTSNSSQDGQVELFPCGEFPAHAPLSQLV